MTNEFSLLDLHPMLVQTVTELGYTAPTPIQAAIIPAMLTGRDVIGQAQTGTGKTAAFSLPILQTLETKRDHVQSLIVAPTRELALQVAGAMHQYGRLIGVRVLAVYGGQPYVPQIRQLEKGVDIVVGTPGRLLDLIQKGALNISRVSSVVLDEADEMLSMGFIGDIEAILEKTPPDRQTALFSATLPAKIRQLAERYMHNPQSVTIGQKKLTVASVEQRYYLVNETERLAALTRLIEAEPISSALIFVQTRLGTGELVNALSVRGVPAEALNGDLSQDARERVLQRFRNNQIKVLVATDVAARGLDIDDISHVLNYDLPRDPEIYVHRVGRTARAGKPGIAISLLTPQERWRLGRIEGYSKQKLKPCSLPTVEDIQAQRDARLLEQVRVWLRRGRCTREREIVATLIEEGHDPIQIAAIALKLAREDDKKRPIAPVSEIQEWQPAIPRRAEKRENRKNSPAPTALSHEKGMVRLTLSSGKSDGTRVNHIVGALTHYADIPGGSIGKISIQNKHTFVDVPEKFVEKVLSRAGAYRIGRQSVAVALAQ
ncbi:MAG: DEAD/DEAH box helicase [Desulfobacterales bacterium]|jgi:ATP-dependent RNA helicase DeaD|nr:DEAD/DEAH box helicase [Desulfobacterales bacterium]